MFGDYGEKINLSSYSYLGLIGHPDIDDAVRRSTASHSTGSHGVRLLSGTNDLHSRLEDRLANFKKSQDCVTFTSGYAANLSIIAGLVRPRDYVIGDKLNHASIVDGCKLSGAGFFRFNHNDPDHLHHRLRQLPVDANVLVVCDGVFSMDGDILNLPKISEVCKENGALLMVDEAHSLGVIGEKGTGIEEHFDLPPDAVDIKMGTLSKTIPSNGGYACASSEIVEFLKHQGRGFIFSAAMTPQSAAAAIAALDVIECEPERVGQLHENAELMRMLLNRAGIDTLQSETAILPAFCGADQRAWFLAKYCIDNGVFVQGIPYPVVSRNSARLRCTVTSEHSSDDIHLAASVIAEAFRKIA
ncbi:aminotransferase class I/II-fold pyridoxal phosphate-dependent enzyme [Ruegeria atlantica]|uniref:aminotransferase class I/II-fold pyridoxal phosphate-dependent enzyme n=1 Tax=Ruegeria atlantica TaxID=81569 RepID=UPI002495841B|nr:aminotransferase class I/II-fold pyridoxal phosphate-dependent enzyme [Ruegeria atlantica]